MNSPEYGSGNRPDPAATRLLPSLYRAVQAAARYRVDAHFGWLSGAAGTIEDKFLKDKPIIRVLAIGLLVACCLIWTALAGRDLNWDLLNYHYYTAHAFWTDRLAKDFMAASVQSYLNPIAYLPFYWMVEAGWHSLIIGLVLATLHSTNLILLLLIAEETLFREAKAKLHWGFAAAIAGGLSPVFLTEVGDTFNDVTATIGVLLGIYLALRRTELSVRILLAGLAMGIAAGLKLTNSIFVVAMIPSLAIVHGNWSTRARSALLFGAGAALGFAVTEGYWGYKVYQEFGNPFFPYMNKLFSAPDFPSVNIVNDRFLLSSLQDLVTFPLRLASLRSWEYTEVVAPDLRLIALIVVSVTGLVLSVIRTSRQQFTSSLHRLEATQKAFLSFFVISLALWIASSGNGRYGLPVLLLIGPLLVWAVYKAFTTKIAVLVTSLALALQIFHMTNGGNPRWRPAPWKAEWFDITVPPALTRQPFLYLSQGIQSYSFVVPFLNSDSAFVNILGQWSIPSEGYGSVRLKNLLQKYDGRTRILAPFPKASYVSGKPTSKLQSVMNASLDRLSLRVRPETCVELHMPILDDSPSTTTKDAEHGISEILLTCEVAKANARDPKLAREERRLTPVFGLMESTCPGLFSPPGSALDRVDKYWKKYYANTDVSLWSDGITLFYTKSPTLLNVGIGNVSNLEEIGKEFDCRSIRRPIRHFE